MDSQATKFVYFVLIFSAARRVKKLYSSSYECAMSALQNAYLLVIINSFLKIVLSKILEISFAASLYLLSTVTGTPTV